MDCVTALYIEMVSFSEKKSTCAFILFLHSFSILGDILGEFTWYQHYFHSAVRNANFHGGVRYMTAAKAKGNIQSQTAFAWHRNEICIRMKIYMRFEMLLWCHVNKYRPKSGFCTGIKVATVLCNQIITWPV